MKNQWVGLAPLYSCLAFSAATVLNDVLYSLGGEGATESVQWLDLRNGKNVWLSTKRVNLCSDLKLSVATVVKNKILYFGPHSDAMEYCVLSEEEKGSIEVESRFKGLGSLSKQ